MRPGTCVAWLVAQVSTHCFACARVCVLLLLLLLVVVVVVVVVVLLLLLLLLPYSLRGSALNSSRRPRLQHRRC